MKKQPGTISRRAYDTLRREIKDAQERVMQQGLRARDLEAQLEAVERTVTIERRQRDELSDTILVLQSDRDRLTAALDVCVRRLVSPGADRHVHRGGWRAANLALAKEPSLGNERAMTVSEEVERDRLQGRGVSARRG
jgi:hypothetical protein